MTTKGLAFHRLNLDPEQRLQRLRFARDLGGEASTFARAGEVVQARTTARKAASIARQAIEGIRPPTRARLAEIEAGTPLGAILRAIPPRGRR